MSDELIGVMVTIVIVAAIAMVGNAILMPLDSGQEAITEQRQEIVELNGDEWTELADGTGTNQTVLDSRGLGMRFDGTDGSYVASTSAINVAGDDTWTVSQPVLSVHDTTQTQTFLAIGDPNLLLQYVPNGSSGNWSAVFVSASDSYRVNVSAPSPDSGGASWVYVTRDGETLTIWRDSVEGESVNVSSPSAITGDLTDDSNCNCTLDETRTFDDVLNSSERTQLRDEPVKPLPGTNRTARLMYDEGGWTDSVLIFWSDASATRGPNTTYVEGFPGNELGSASELLNSDDYQWRQSGPQIRGINDYQSAPVFYVTYSFEGSASAIRNAWTGATELLDVVFLVLMASVVLGALMKFRTQ